MSARVYGSSSTVGFRSRVLCSIALVIKFVILFLPALVVISVVIVGFPKTSILMSLYAGHDVIRCFVVSFSSPHMETSH